MRRGLSRRSIVWRSGRRANLVDEGLRAWQRRDGKSGDRGRRMGVVCAQDLERGDAQGVLLTSDVSIHVNEISGPTILPLCVPTICAELSILCATCSDMEAA